MERKGDSMWKEALLVFLGVFSFNLHYVSSIATISIQVSYSTYSSHSILFSIVYFHYSIILCLSSTLLLLFPFISCLL